MDLHAKKEKRFLNIKKSKLFNYIKELKSLEIINSFVKIFFFAIQQYTMTRISIGYMFFSVITLVYVHHFAWYLVSNISLSCFSCMWKEN